jgi:hypothetical protein
MSNGTAGADLEGDGLRERKSQQNVNFAKEPESDESGSEEDEKDKKTIGRTPDGTGKCLCTSFVKRNKQEGLYPGQAAVCRVQTRFVLEETRKASIIP